MSETTQKDTLQDETVAEETVEVVKGTCPLSSTDTTVTCFQFLSFKLALPLGNHK